jgi:FAD binding domain
VTAAPYDARNLGDEIKRLWPPLSTITFIGMMFNSSNEDLKHFFRATRSLRSAVYVAKRLVSHFKDLALYGRGVQITSGNALVARLAKTAFDLKIPIVTGTAAKHLLIENGAVTGAVVSSGGRERRIVARRGVVLACGGFPHDLERIARAYPHLAQGGEHVSPTLEGNTGDGIKMAEAAGAVCDIRFPNAAAWMPVSKVPMGQGRTGVFPHLVDRYKPGVIAVNRRGLRFANESNSYHDTGAAMIADHAGERETTAWLICDHATIRKYGLGYAKPAPVPIGIYLRNGYLQSASSLRDLAAKIGVDFGGLHRTVSDYNIGAAAGEDRQFGRGTTAFNRFLGDPEHKPNPNVAPIGKGPYYALQIFMGDLGTFDGLTTDTVGRVLTRASQPIPGLYAVGNDRASIMGGNYPGAGITLGPIMTFGYITGRHLAGHDDAASAA